jgi:hypothetical protein
VAGFDLIDPPTNGAIGDLIGGFEPSGAQNLLIVFAADHGDSTVRVPPVYHWPREANVGAQSPPGPPCYHDSAWPAARLQQGVSLLALLRLEALEA